MKTSTRREMRRSMVCPDMVWGLLLSRLMRDEMASMVILIGEIKEFPVADIVTLKRS